MRAQDVPQPSRQSGAGMPVVVLMVVIVPVIVIVIVLGGAVRMAHGSRMAG